MPPINTWPQRERPREKLLERGAASLSDAELLAVLLQTGIRGKTALDLAREALQQHGGLRALLSASQRHFCARRGLGPAKYVLLQAAVELARRHFQETLVRGDALSNPADTQRFLAAQLRDRPAEVFACLFLDNRHRVIRFAELFQGTINGASVHPREVARQALALNAAAVIVAHNHPSGVAEPSTADRHLTQALGQALALIEVRLLDHLVVGDGETVSFAERGWL